VPVSTQLVGVGGGAARDDEGQAPACPQHCTHGAVKARRSRIPRSGIALATPKAPLTWQGRPRTLRATPANPHATTQEPETPQIPLDNT
jgi:hypothetical protein